MDAMVFENSSRRKAARLTAISMKTKTDNEIQVETTVSAYDVVNAFLVSSIVVIGTLVTVLFLIWLTMLMNKRQVIKPTVMIETSFGDEKPEGFEDDIYEPGVEEFPEVEVPQLADAIEALTEAVSSVEAAIEARDGDAAEMGKGKGFGSREGGPGSGNFRGVPEHKRWKIEYSSPDQQTYATQLSFFDIDIGVISKTNNDIVRLADPGNAPRAIQTDRNAEKKAFYFVHEKLQLRRWDEFLVKQNGVPFNRSDHFTVQFYPETTRGLLRQIEAQYLAEKGIQLVDVLRTRFKVVPDGAGFTFRVVSVDHK